MPLVIWGVFFFARAALRSHTPNLAKLVGLFGTLSRNLSDSEHALPAQHPAWAEPAADIRHGSRQSQSEGINGTPPKTGLEELIRRNSTPPVGWMLECDLESKKPLWRTVTRSHGGELERDLRVMGLAILITSLPFWEDMGDIAATFRHWFYPRSCGCCFSDCGGRRPAKTSEPSLLQTKLFSEHIR